MTTPGFVEVPQPSEALFRFGKASGPLALPSEEVLRLSALHRFDDPGRRFRVLYAAESPEGCLLEYLAGFRPSVDTLAELAAMPGDDPMPAHGQVAFALLSDRRMASFHVESKPKVRFLDLRALETREHLRRELVGTLKQQNLQDFDMSDAVGRVRVLSQAIGGWAYDHEFNGIVYPSRLDSTSINWALFEPLSIRSLHERELAPNDADLTAVLKRFGLTLVL